MIGWSVQGLILCVGQDVSIRGWLKLTLNNMVFYGTVYGNGALWFLLTIFFIRTLSEYVLLKVHPLLIALVSFALAYLHFSCSTSYTPWYLGSFFSGFCFFSLGCFFRNCEHDKWIVTVAALVYFTSVITFLMGMFELPDLYFHKNSLNHGSYLLFYPVALSGIIVTNNLFRKAYDYWKFPVLSYIGRNAMNFYVTHWIVLVVAQFVFTQLLHVQSTKYLFLLYVASCVVLLPIINKIINLLKNRKNV